MSNVLQSQAPQSNSRPNVLEGRINSQERTLALLLEQAFRIKEEMAASLQSSQGCVQAEALSHSLLESHIHTITRIVKHLSLNVQTLERQIALRDSVACGTTQAVQWLDHKNMNGIGDLRGRVARCDASIAKLSTEVSAGERQVTRLQQEVTQLRSAVDTRIKELQVKLQRDLGRMEPSLTEVSQRQRSFISEMQNQVKQLEILLSTKMMEVMKEYDLLKKWTEQQLHGCTGSFKQTIYQLQEKMQAVESGLLERLQALEARSERFEANQESSLASQVEQLTRMETKVSKKVTSVENHVHHELQLLKQKYHKGFRSVQDAMESLKEIAELKSRLEKEKILIEINHICSKVTDQMSEF